MRELAVAATLLLWSEKVMKAELWRILDAKPSPKKFGIVTKSLHGLSDVSPMQSQHHHLMNRRLNSISTIMQGIPRASESKRT